jgi:hypothetical protein
MKQSSLGLSNTVKRTRKREFLDAMELVVPWSELVALIEPYAPESGRRGQQPFAVQTLLRICSIPDDCIDPNRYPLFMARAVLQELIESLQSNRGAEPC